MVKSGVGRFASGAVVLFLAFAVLPVPQAEANPVIPYCGLASLGGATSATADLLVLPDVCEALTGRVFPEALVDPDYLAETGPNGFTGGSTGFATDYVGYFEFQRGLEYLEAQHPDYIEVHEVATSAGNSNLLAPLGFPEGLPVYMLEISNENSPIPRDQKQNLLFMLSIHGNEKGGREGGFRVLEDLLRNIGFATETVQNGAGLPSPIEKPTGGEVQTYHDYLDFQNLFLLFPNADGWSCDELEYGVGDPLGLSTATGLEGCAGNFRRTNANGVDLNRQNPTLGWMRQNSNSHEAVKEPEPVGYLNWMVEQRENSTEGFQWDYAIDIHGMLNHQNFGAIMLPAGSFTPQEMYRSLRLAETLKERWNADSHFDEWRTTFETLEAASAALSPLSQTYQENCAEFECPLPGSALAQPSSSVSSSQFAEYYTVIDAIGYTDSGFSGDFFAQTTGLNAPGYDIELAYNHIVTGSQYEGPGALFNDYHVHMVRHIVKSFMDAAALDVKISYETSGLRTAYVPPTFVATNLDDDQLTPGGWAGENPGDDAWDYGPEQPFFARPAKYWEDMKPFLCADCGGASVPGVLERRDASQLSAGNLATFDTLVIPGTAINQFVSGEAGENVVADGEPDAARVQMVLDWVNEGGHLVLTDAALAFFDLSGLTDGAVDRTTGYMGGIRMDLDHPLLEKVRGGVKQTYEPTPLGFGVTGASPNWYIDRAAFEGIGGSVAGLTCPGPQLTQYCEENPVALGEVDVGAGSVTFIGALLPDPTEEFYHPYGLDHYATTYSGNQILRNMLGWTEVFSAPPVVISEEGEIVQTDNEPEPVIDDTPDAMDDDNDTPAVGMVLLLALLGAVVAARRRV